MELGGAGRAVVFNDVEYRTQDWRRTGGEQWEGG